MSGFVYIRSEPGLWTVGTYGPGGKWHPESDHGNPDAAAERVAALNGTPGAVLTAAPATLPELERECGTCEGTREAFTPEWLAWANRDDRTDCPACGGKGRVPTEAGRALLAFLQRHPPALTRVSTPKD